MRLEFLRPGPTAAPLIALAIAISLSACGGKSKTDLAKECGQKAAKSLTPGFGGGNAAQLQQTVAKAAEDYYMQTGKCSAS